MLFMPYTKWNTDIIVDYLINYIDYNYVQWQIKDRK